MGEIDAIRCAKKNGYDTANYLGVYEGNNCYEATFYNGEARIVGLPAFILEKNNKLIWVQDKKSFDILDTFYSD